MNSPRSTCGTARRIVYENGLRGDAGILCLGNEPATGSVTIELVGDGSGYCNAPIANGSVTCTMTSGSVAGSATVIATYSGDSTYNSSAGSTPLTIQAAQSVPFQPPVQPHAPVVSPSTTQSVLRSLLRPQPPSGSQPQSGSASQPLSQTPMLIAVPSSSWV